MIMRIIQLTYDISYNFDCIFVYVTVPFLVNMLRYIEIVLDLDFNFVIMVWKQGEEYLGGGGGGVFGVGVYSGVYLGWDIR